MKPAEKQKWYPVYTNPRSEKKAYELLVQQGIQSYLPLQPQEKQWSDRKKWVLEPVIKSYVFVNIVEKQMMDVLKTRGIARFLYFSGKVASMPDRQIEHLKLLLASNTGFELSTRTFSEGSRVEVVAGPLKGMLGELVEQRSRTRLLVRLEHTGQALLVHLPSSFVETVDFVKAKI